MTKEYSNMVLEIYRGTQKSKPMERVNGKVTVVKDGGIDGDRYPDSGFWSNKRISNPKRGVTFISREGIELGNQRLQKQRYKPYTWQETKRQVVLEIDPMVLNNLVGRQFQIGSARFEGTELCIPCPRPGLQSGRRLEEAKAFEVAYAEFGGLRAKVVMGGEFGPDSVLVPITIPHPELSTCNFFGVGMCALNGCMREKITREFGADNVADGSILKDRSEKIEQEANEQGCQNAVV